MYQILKGFFVFVSAFLAFAATVYAQDIGSKTIIRKVVSQQQDEFKVAVKDGFIEYLSMMSGNSAVAELPQVAPLIAQADKFLLEFRYEPLAEADLEIVSEFEQSQQAKWRLKLQFDAKAVESRMFKAGAPIWPLPRPDLMVWLAHESDLGLRNVLKQDDINTFKGQLEGVASTRGVGLKFPVFDQEDQYTLSTSALWGLFKDDIEKASIRYQLKNSVAIRIYPDSGAVWQFNGLIVMPNDTLSFSGTSESRDSAAINALNEALNLMSENYAIQVDPNDRRELVISVESVATYDQLHNLMADINELLMVQDVTPLSLQKEHVRLKLKILGDEQRLKLMLANKPYLIEQIKVDDQPNMRRLESGSQAFSQAPLVAGSGESPDNSLPTNIDGERQTLEPNASEANLLDANTAEQEPLAIQEVVTLYYQYQVVNSAPVTPDLVEEKLDDSQVLIEE